MKTLNKSIAALAIAGLFAALSSRSLADSVDRGASPLAPDRSQLVRAADLDLSKPEHVRTLYRRIRHTARSLCETEHSAPWDVKRELHKRQCFERAVDRAVSNADQPELTALHRSARERVAGL